MRNPIHTLAASLLATSSILLPDAAARGVPPDLVPTGLAAPEQVNVGTQVAVHFATATLGGPLETSYTAEIVLTADSTIDAGDLVVASKTTAFLGQHSVLATIPSDLTWGTYQWGVRILPVEGEWKTSNNTFLGLATNVIQVDLSIQDASPLTVFVRPTDDEVPVPEVLVENAGTPGDILVYQAEALTPAPWLTFDPPENYAVAGEEPNPTRLVLNVAGLPLGSYQTTVRFQNLYLEDDFEDLDVTLVIGDPKFETGDRVQGQISNPGEVDEIVFDGLKGMKVPFEVKSSSGDIKPVLELVAPSGDVETTLKFKSSKGYSKQIVKLKESGEYRLLISGKKDTTGDYKIRTSRSMPKKAKAYTKSLDAGESMKVLMLAGATLDIAASDVEAPMILALTTPSGALMDMSGHLSQEPGGELKVAGLQIDDAGQYGVSFSGDGSATIHVAPVQPKLGKSKVYLD